MNTLNIILQRWQEYLRKKNKKDYITAYIHIPFCSRRCRYCDFPSRVIKSSNDIDGYLDFLQKEMSLLAPLFKGHSISGLYIGGGSPSILELHQMKRLFKMIGSCFELDLDDQNMFTIEINPIHLNEDKIDLISSSIVNRVSLGIQSLDSNVLAIEGRECLPMDRMFYLLSHLMTKMRHKGCRINTDLIFGLNQQSLKIFRNDFSRLVQWDIPRITIYPCRRNYDNGWNQAFKRRVVATVKSIHESFPNYDLIQSMGHFKGINHFEPEYNFINKNYNHCYKKRYQDFPFIHNSNIGFGYYADSFIHPGRCYYRRTRREYIILHDKESGIVNPWLDKYFINAEMCRKAKISADNIPY
ncbi:MAG: radical SAM protein [Pseudomonadota bacterium]